jgi:predicted PurR-regulated permease PerM
MLVFGVDIPLVEVIFVLCIIIFLLLVEAIVVISLLMKQMHKTNKLGDLIQKLSQTLLEIKSAEIQELDKLKRK